VLDAADRRLKPTTMLKKYLITGLLIWVPLHSRSGCWTLSCPAWTARCCCCRRPGVGELARIPAAGAACCSALVLLLTGMAAANIMGQRLVRWWEGCCRAFRSCVRSTRAQAGFRYAVVARWELVPARVLWSSAARPVGDRVVVGAPGERVAAQLGADSVVVYVPTAPNPTSATRCRPPRRSARVDMSVDEALKFVISLGVVGADVRSESRKFRKASNENEYCGLVDERFTGQPSSCTAGHRRADHAE